MSDTPERIWIDAWGGNWSPVSGGTQGIEYIRADIHAAEIAALQARIEALVDAAKGLGRWCVKELPPHPDLTPLLESLDAAITAAKGE